MYIQIVNLRVKPGRVDDFLDAFRKNREGTRKEPGNIQFDLLRSRDDQHRFVVYEVFASEAALAAHRQTDHYKECNRRFTDILEGDRRIDVMRSVMTDHAGA